VPRIPPLLIHATVVGNFADSAVKNGEAESREVEANKKNTQK